MAGVRARRDATAAGYSVGPGGADHDRIADCQNRPVPRTVVLLPVKRPELAKTRLSGLGDEARRMLATAFARDTLAAASAAPTVDEVVVVTDDAAVAGHARTAGCLVTPDAGELNAALRAAAAVVPPATFVVALCADLPALSSADLDAALRTMAGRPAFVPDRQGTGTTAYAAPRAGFAPAFGAASAARHRASGAAEVGRHLASLRLDVDDEPSLADAASIGLGAHTRAALDAVRRPGESRP